MNHTRPTVLGASSELKRSLNSRQMTMIGIGSAIGTGLFLGSSLAISQAGPAVIISYIVCGLVALAIAWATAEMVVLHPGAGGFGPIVGRYLGPGAGFVIRWTYWALMVIVVGGEMIASGLYIQYWWPGMPLWVVVAVLAVVVLAINAGTVRFFGESEYWFSMIKVTAIVMFLLFGLVLITVGLPDHPATGLGNLTDHGGFMPNGFNNVLTSMVFVVISYAGAEAVSITAGEAENPERDIPRAARAMVLRLAFFYVLAISVVVIVVPWTVTAQGGTVESSPFVTVFVAAGIPAAATIMNFVVLTAALSSANACLYFSTRMMHSLAQERLAPSWAGRLTASGVPRNALGLSALGLVLAVALSWNSKSQSYIILFGISVFALIVVWLLILATHTALRVHRKRAGLEVPAVRLRGAPYTSGLAAVFLLAVLGSTFFVDGLAPAWQFGLPFFAILWCAYWFMRKTGRCQHLVPGPSGEASSAHKR